MVSVTFCSASRSKLISLLLPLKGRFVLLLLPRMEKLSIVTLRCVRFTGASVNRTISVPACVFTSGEVIPGNGTPETNKAATTMREIRTPATAYDMIFPVPFMFNHLKTLMNREIKDNAFEQAVQVFERHPVYGHMPSSRPDLLDRTTFHAS